MAQTVTVFSTKLNKKTKITTSATTWGELQAELVTKGIYNASSMKAVDRATRMSFEAPSGEITDGMTIFLLPTKNDSGVDVSEEQFEEFVQKMHEMVDEFHDSITEAADEVLENSDNEELMDDANDLARELRG